MMWTAIVVAGLASYVLRVLPLFLLQHVELSPRLSEALHHAATGAMAVMLVTGAAHAADAGPSGTGAPAGRVAAVVAGVGVALLLGRRGRSMPVVVVSGLAVYLVVLAGAAVVHAT